MITLIERYAEKSVQEFLLRTNRDEGERQRSEPKDRHISSKHPLNDSEQQFYMLMHTYIHTTSQPLQRNSVSLECLLLLFSVGCLQNTNSFCIKHDKIVTCCFVHNAIELLLCKIYTNTHHIHIYPRLDILIHTYILSCQRSRLCL